MLEDNLQRKKPGIDKLVYLRKMRWKPISLQNILKCHYGKLEQQYIAMRLPVCVIVTLVDVRRVQPRVLQGLVLTKASSVLPKS